MISSGIRIVAALALSSLLLAKHATVPGCGTHSATSQEELYLHQRSERLHPASTRVKRAAAARSANVDAGNIAVMDDSDGVVARRNPFNLDTKTLVFTPADHGYKVANDGPAFKPPSGATIDGLGDDDAREAPLPFAFPFYGKSYNSVWINSNGNLTFGEGDGDTTDQSLGRLAGGAPRISPLFTDLDPTAVRQGAMRISSDPGLVVITWDRIPLYSDSGFGLEQTFQVRLFQDGRIEMAYNGVNPDDAVVGISPGRLMGTVALIPFIDATSAEFSGPIAEVFTSTDAVDVAAAAQKFYATHEDSYDYLVVFNALDIDARTDAVAYEVTVRNNRTGYGDRIFHSGQEYGSDSRLQSVLNMGPLTQYPVNPNVIVDLRRPAGDTPLTVLGHETGHLFLAFASVADPDNPDNYPMLGRANVHWAFTFNSEASLLEGNRIQDNGESASPRFTTIKTVEGYSPLDRYLMGFIPPSDVPPTFYVANSRYSQSRIPQTGLSFDGVRHNVTLDDVIAVEGRRTPDSTVSQRRFRFGFILIVPAGGSPTAAQLAQVEGYRAAFEPFYGKASGGNATADATLKRAVKFSAWPAAGLLQGRSGTATVTLTSPAIAPQAFFIERQNGLLDAPASVIVPAGAAGVRFSMQGLRPGVEELTLRPADSSYETVAVRVQVQSAPTALTLEQVSADGEFRVSDMNRLPYSGVRLIAGSLTATTDEQGLAKIDLPPGSSITVAIEGAPSSAIAVQTPVPPAIFAVTNAASYAPGITPGAYATAFGAYLDNTVQVLVNGELAPLTYVSASQLNFRVPTGIVGDIAKITLLTQWFNSPDYRVQLQQVSPGIFAVVNRGTALEIYATGLNGAPAQVTVAGLDARVLYTGQPQFPGLDQINVLVPGGVPPGPQSVIVTANGVRSNEYKVTF